MGITGPVGAIGPTGRTSGLLLFNNSESVTSSRYIGLGEQKGFNSIGFTDVSVTIPQQGLITSFTVGSKGHSEFGQGPVVALAIRAGTLTDVDDPTLYPPPGITLTTAPGNTQKFDFDPPLVVNSGDLASVAVLTVGTWTGYKISGTVTFQSS